MPHCAGVLFRICIMPSAEPAAVARMAGEHHYLANVASIIEEAHADDPVVPDGGSNMHRRKTSGSSRTGIGSLSQT